MKIIVTKNSSFCQLSDPDYLPPGTEIHLNEHFEFHRENGPAIVYKCGIKRWYKNGKLHRLNGPAVVRPGKSYVEHWYKNGKQHRDDGPSSTFKKGKDINYSWHYRGREARGGAIVSHKLQRAMVLHDPKNITRLIITSFRLKKYIIKNHPEYVNWLFLDKELQELLIKRRPDLISKLGYLDPELKEKYQHEVSLAGLEI